MYILRNGEMGGATGMEREAWSALPSSPSQWSKKPGFFGGVPVGFMVLVNGLDACEHAGLVRALI